MTPVDKSSGSTKLSYQLNVHAVFLHILQHIFVTLVVITSALVVMYATGGWTAYIDPVLSLVVVAFILKTSLPLLKECLMIFMQTVPAYLQLERLQEKLLLSVPEVVGVHELHIWQLAGDQVVGMILFDCNLVPVMSFDIIHSVIHVTYYGLCILSY